MSNTCSVCKKDISYLEKFCSPECRAESLLPLVVKSEDDGSPLKKVSPPREVRNNAGQFVKGQTPHNKGVPHSEAAREAMREASALRWSKSEEHLKNSLAKTGDKNPNFGKPRDPETCRAISASLLDVPRPQNGRVGHSVSQETIEKIRKTKEERKATVPGYYSRAPHSKLIWDQKPEFEAHGLRYVPFSGVVPDGLAIDFENQKIYAVEVEMSGSPMDIPNFGKYEKFKIPVDDVYWFIEKRHKSKVSDAEDSREILIKGYHPTETSIP